MNDLPQHSTLFCWLIETAKINSVEFSVNLEIMLETVARKHPGDALTNCGSGPSSRQAGSNMYTDDVG
ncbi:MAG TPA: hypothetical protein DIU10_12290 [Sulfitobacter sp.]|nr:hypothetical protein [Sulfitobacter sp.]